MVGKPKELLDSVSDANIEFDAFDLLLDNLKVLVPVEILIAGFGVEYGFLMKKVPIRSP